MGGKKKKQVVEEELKPKTPQITELMDKSDMDKTQFISFMPSDGIYSDQVSFLGDKATAKEQSELAAVMRELLKQLNWLRYMSFKQFWATVQFNLSLKYCLQSCLLFLQRKKYNEYMHQPEQDQEAEQLEDPQKFQQKVKKHQLLEYQQHIYRILIVVYFRILNAEDQNYELAKQFKCHQSIYDNWILDIPKLFNFMDIYGDSNQQITKSFIEKVFEINSDFKLDYLDVLATMAKHVFPDIFQQFKFIHDRSEFEKDLNQDTLRRQMKHLFLVKDITSSFVNALKFFPPEVRIYVATSLALAPLENIYYQIHTAYKNWQMKHLKESVHSLMDSIEQDVISIWISIFQIFREVSLEERNMGNVLLDFYQIKEVIFENLNRLQQFGIVISQGKKGKTFRNYMLLEQIMQKFDFEDFINQLLEKEDKFINHERIKEFLNVIQKLNQVKRKRLNAGQDNSDTQNTEIGQIEEIQQPQELKKQNSVLPEIVPVRKQSSHISAQKKQEKEDIINSRMEKARKPKKAEKTNQREYEDEYDDFHDYNRKLQENNMDSDSEIEQIPQNPNRFFNKNNTKQSQKPAEVGKYQQRNNKYIEKKASKQYDRSEKPNNKQSFRGDDNSRRGGRKGDYKPAAKKQYKQKQK